MKSERFLIARAKQRKELPVIKNLQAWSIFAMLLIILTPPAWATYSLPASRIVEWNSAGSTDWAKTRTTICTSLSPSGGNDSAAITTALSSCPSGQVVKLNPGTFNISAAIQWPKSGVTLRGSGPTQTTLRVLSGATGNVFDFWNGHGSNPDWDWSASPARSIIAGNTKGSTAITTSAAHAWVVGDYVLIDQSNDMNGDPPWNIAAGYYGSCNWCSRASGTRLKGQVVRITAIPTSTTATFTPPLYTDYNSNFSPQGIKASGYVKDVSIESLKIDNSGNYASQLVYSYGLYNSLFYDLDIVGIRCSDRSAAFFLFNSSFNTIRRSTIHDAGCSQTNNGYGVFLHYGCSVNLIEDNIFHHLILTVASEGSNSGNVIAYNYNFSPLYINGDTSVNSFTIMGHGGGTFMNLYEGNMIENSKLRIDAGFGSQHNLVFLRNRISQNTGSNVGNGRSAFDLEFLNYYYSLLGNVIGSSGYETKYQCYNESSTTCSDSVKTNYRIGYNQPYTNNLPGDAKTLSTLIRHGNWDYVTKGVAAWDGGSDHDIPDSLYLGGKPAWFGSCSWPPYGPEANPTIQTLPAKARYEGSTVCSGTGSGGALTPPPSPTNLVVQ